MGDRVVGGAAVESVTVAIPVRDAGPQLARTLASLAAQTVSHELVVCDSGSRDGSAEIACRYGARVIEIPASKFSHGGTRNMLMAEARGSHVALLSQDAEPEDERWLEKLLAGFELADDVAIACGSYRPRPCASVPVRIELESWFASLSADGTPRVERLEAGERSLAVGELMGRRGFFTDANACVARSAWERVPFRAAAYAEDRVLAIDMLRAGYAKAFIPAAAVLHSHEYTVAQELRRCFDEWRGLREVYGWREPATPAHLLRQLRGRLGRVWRELAVSGVAPARRVAVLAAAGCHDVARLTGAVLGSRADLLPAPVRRQLSLERRASFVPLDLLDTPPGRDRTA